MQRSLVMFAVLTTLGSASAQTTWYVDDDAPGDPGPGQTAISDPLEDGSALHPFDGIQEAIDAALVGDTVLVADGVYTGVGNRDLNFGGKDLTLRSENGPGTCVIDVQQTPFRRAMNFVSGEGPASVVQGLTMTGGRPQRGPAEEETIGLANGGAVFCQNASPTFVDCVIRGNVPQSETAGITGGYVRGGGMYFRNSRSLLVDCVVRDNRPDVSGFLMSFDQVWIGVGIYAAGSDLVLLNCRIEDNSLVERSGSPFDTTGLDRGNGGGMVVTGGSLTMLNCHISGNRAPDGGARGTFQRQFAGRGGHGGGIFASNATLWLERCVVAGNHAGQGQDTLEFDGEDGGAGGGLYLQDTTATIRECILTDNAAGHGGMGWAGGNVPGGGGGDGGAIAVVDSNVEIVNSVLGGNRSGALGVGTIQDRNGQGGAIGAAGASSVTVINSTIANNRLVLGEQPIEEEGGLYVESPAVVSVANTIVWNNQPRSLDPNSQAISVVHSIIDGGFPGIGNLDTDPQFTDATGADGDPSTGADNDYRPVPGAPGNDAGENALLPSGVGLDLDGAARIADDAAAPNVCGGICVDIGAYEAGNGSPVGDVCDEEVTANNDCNNDGIVDRCQLASGDCDRNGLLDVCELASGTGADCNNNGLLDACEPDCDRNGVPDDCDLIAGAVDCNNNQILDVCEFGDCDGNGILDRCEIDDGTLIDCDGNLQPDVCQSDDCDGNGIADSCEVSDPALDCDQNGVLDVCQQTGDCDENGLIDACELADGMASDCDNSGVIDVCEVLGDCDNDGLADGCEEDCDADGLPDDCELPAERVGLALDVPGGTSRLRYEGADGVYSIASGNITIEAWVRPAVVAPGTIQTIVRKTPNNYWLRLRDGRVQFSYRGTALYEYATDALVQADAWQHVAVVHTFGTEVIEIFLNGQVIGGTWESVPEDVPQTSDNPLYVVNSNSRQAPLVGLIDEFRIWDTARTQDQIQDYLQGSLPADAPNLIAYVPFEDGADVVTEVVRGRLSQRNDASWQPLVYCVCSDLTGDGLVSLSDLAVLLANFGDVGPPSAGDVTQDGTIDLADLTLLMSQFGAPCQ